MRLALFLLLPIVLAAQPPSGYTKCADEHGHCSFLGTLNVTYGAGQKWVTVAATDGINCTNTAFKIDPAPGVGKACYTQNTIPVPIPVPTPTPVPSPCKPGEMLVNGQCVPNTAVMLSIAAAQSDPPWLCNSATGTTIYACNPPHATIKRGSLVLLTVDVATVGASTLNADGVNARAIKQRDGVTDARLLPDQPYWLFYDDKVWRLTQ